MTFGNYSNYLPRWSPDGLKIVFASRRDNDKDQIYVMDADGKNQINLSNDKKTWETNPTWSPDGYYIAYTTRSNYLHENGSIYVMKNDGTEKRNVSNGKVDDEDPAWSPDGEWIAFSRSTKKYPGPYAIDIWVMRRDGTDQRPITRNKLYYHSTGPTWSR